MRALVRGARAACLALVACAAIVGCGSEPPGQSGQSGDRDASGESPRIVALSPAIAIILRDVGAGDRVVGRHAWDMVLDPALPVCGDQTGIDFEQLIEVRPTHILTQWGERALPGRLTELADARGWAIDDHRLLTLADVIETCNELDRAFGRRADAEEAGENGERPPRELLGDRLVRTIAEHRRDRASLGPVLLLHGSEPPTALGPGSFHHEILVELGATPAISDGAAYMTLDLEAVAELSPGVIVLIQPREVGSPDPGDAGWAGLERRLGGIPRLDIPAVRGRRVVLIDEPLALIPSSSLIGFARDLARALDGLTGEPDR